MAPLTTHSRRSLYRWQHSLSSWFFCWVASRGLNPLKKLATIAGSSMFVMSILFILMMFAAPAINPNGGFVSADYTVKGLIPQFNVNYFTSLSILVFAVGGCEKISPYVNKVKDPSKGFPKGMIMLAVMVMVWRDPRKYRDGHDV